MLQSQGVGEQVTPAATHVLVDVISVGATSLGRFHRLSVDDRGAGRRLSSSLTAARGWFFLPNRTSALSGSTCMVPARTGIRP